MFYDFLIHLHISVRKVQLKRALKKNRLTLTGEKYVYQHLGTGFIQH